MPYLRLYTTEPRNYVDVVPLIEEFKWSENDLDSPTAGRDLSGLMHRGLTASKRRCDIKLIPCTAAELNPIFALLRNEYFYCLTDLVPAEGPLTMEMYNSTRSGGIAIITTDFTIKHQDASFNIIER